MLFFDMLCFTSLDMTASTDYEKLTHDLTWQYTQAHLYVGTCFDTVGWVIRPVKTVGCITYIVLAQT